MIVVERLFRRLVSALIMAVVTAVMLEAVLQMVAWIVKQNRHVELARTDERALTVLTLGDSNTYGVFVEKSESWPARLQVLLSAATINARVVNMGWPGTNSTVLNWQLEQAIQQAKPDLILVEIGANDSWSRPVFREKISIIQYVQLYSRVYRLWRLGHFNFQNRNDADLRFRHASDVQGDEKRSLSKTFNPRDPDQLASASLQPVDTEGGGSLMLGINTIIDGDTVNLKSSGFESLLHYSMAGIIQQATAHQVPVIFLNYGSNAGIYQQSNRAIKRAQELTGATVIDVRLDRLLNNHCHGYESAPDCKRWFFPDDHPSAEGYQYIAQAVATFLIERQLLTSHNRSADNVRSAAQYP